MNRGFLNGPLLPIYGSGAVSILLFTLPVAANPILVFLMGMAGATLLEYVTGAFLESTFHVRYWDYSMYRFNLNGYICLPASLCWGAFSLLMIRVIHPVVSGWVTMLSPAAALTAALALSAFFAADLFASPREAVDMRSLLQSLSDCSDCGAGYAEGREADEKNIQNDVQYAGDNQKVQWNTTVAHGTENACKHVVSNGCRHTGIDDGNIVVSVHPYGIRRVHECQ